MAYRQASPFVDQFFDINGLPLSGGTIKSYLAGTTTATAMYTDGSGTSAGSSITLNARGEPEVSGNTVNIWLDEGINYKFVLADSSGTSIWTVDGINVGFASGSLDIQGTNPLINFKTGASESFDTRIAQITNGLAFYTGGNAQTVLGMLLDQNRNLLLDPAGAGGAPAAPLHVKGATADYPIKVESTDSTAGVQLSDNATTGVVGIAAVGDVLKSMVGGAAKLDVKSTGVDVTGEAQVGDATDGVKIGHSTANSTGVIDTAYTSTGLELRVGGSEKARIDSSGHLITPNGITLGTSVGTYAASNTLDDYEEGTWTPTIIGNTSGSITGFTVSSATYTKVGNLVTAQCYLTGINTNSHNLVGNINMGGLPFTCAPAYFAISTSYVTLFTDTSDKSVGGYVQSNGNFMYFVAGTSSAHLSTANLQSGTDQRIIITATYRTT